MEGWDDAHGKPHECAKHRGPCVCGCCAIAACSADPRGARFQAPEPPEVLYGTVRDATARARSTGPISPPLVRAQNTLTLKLIEALRAEQPGPNLAVGGYTVHQVLGMLYAGARGRTAE